MYQEFLRTDKHLLGKFFKFLDVNYPNVDEDTFDNILNHDHNLKMLLKSLCFTKKVKNVLELAKKQEDFKGFEEGLVNSFASKIYDSYRIYKNGEKIFRVTEDLALQLMNTELKEVPAKMIKPPYQAIEIECPSDYIVFNPGHRQETKVVSAFVDTHTRKKDKIKFRFTFYRYDTTFLRQENFYSCSFEFDEDRDVQQQLYEKLEEDMKLEQNKKIMNDEEFFKTIRLSITFVLNVLLYISSSEVKVVYHRDGQEKAVKLKGKEKQRFKKMLKERPEIGTIGGEIVLKREDKELYVKHIREGVPLTYRLLVMGHWKRQWFGSFKEEQRHQKLIRIEPYWRGIDNEVISNKVHVVK